MQWFGFYRLYLVKDFKHVLILNYTLEALFQSLPLLIIGGHPNAVVTQDAMSGL